MARVVPTGTKPRRLRRLGRGSLIACAALVAAGCASTTLRDAWFDPSVRSKPFARILVVSVGGDLTQRRIFEDALAGKLATVGVEGIPGYRLLRDGTLTEDEIKGGVASSGSDGLLLVHIRGVQTRTDVRTTMVPVGPVGAGWWGWYGGWVAQPQVIQTRIARIETSLFDVASDRLVWTGVTETYDPSSFRREADGLATVIAHAIASQGLTPSKAAA